MFAKASLPCAVFEELDGSQSRGHYIFKLCWEMYSRTGQNLRSVLFFFFSFQSKHTFHPGILFPSLI